MPPMEFAGPVYVLEDNGSVVERTAYRVHRCDPEKVVAWQEYISTMAELKGPDSYEGEVNMYAAARERERQEVWEIALLVNCDKCGANADEKCRKMSQHLVKTGEIVEARHPHPVRLEAAYAARKEAISNDN